MTKLSDGTRQRCTEEGTDLTKLSDGTRQRCTEEGSAEPALNFVLNGGIDPRTLNL